jgi:hypothetical protein
MAFGMIHRPDLDSKAIDSSWTLSSQGFFTSGLHGGSDAILSWENNVSTPGR